MKLRFSEVFENYVKISEEQGIITKEAQEKSKTNPRFDSQTLSDIEILYGVKAKGEDDKHILDQAHPDTVVISPAHDKMNGVVENLQERHNVMVDIATKPNRGIHTHNIYAKAYNDLLNELVKTAFLLDRESEEQLMNLADECSNKLTKTAAIPLIVYPILVGVGTLAGALYTSNNPASQGLKQDTEMALKQINEAAEKYPQLSSFLDPVTSTIQKMSIMYDTFVSNNDRLANMLLKVSSAATIEQKRQEIVSNVQSFFSSNQDKEMEKHIKSFKEVCDAFLESAPLAIEQLESARERYETADNPVWHLIKEVGYSISQREEDDAVDWLKNLTKSASKLSVSAVKQIGMIQKLRSYAQKASETKEENSTVSPAMKEVLNPKDAPKSPAKVEVKPAPEEDVDADKAIKEMTED